MSLVVGPRDGTFLPGEFEVVIKIRSETTSGVLAVVEETVPPRRLVSPHTHENDVLVHVLAGEIGVLVGDQIEIAPAGSWVLKPRKVLHAMWNARSDPARIIEVLTPGGTERWFEEMSELAPDDSEGWEELCRRYGIRFESDSPWTPELKQRYSLL